MGNFWLKLKVWLKAIVFGALLMYVVLFVYNNSGKPVEFWWWIGHSPNTSVFFLASFAFLAGMIAAVLIRTTLTTLRQVRDLQSRSRTSRLERDVMDMKVKAAMLQTKQSAAPSTSGGVPPGAFAAPDPTGTADEV